MVSEFVFGREFSNIAGGVNPLIALAFIRLSILTDLGTKVVTNKLAVDG